LVKDKSLVIEEQNKTNVATPKIAIEDNPSPNLDFKKTDIHENSSAEDSENSESDSDSDLEDDDKDRNDDRKKDKTPKQEFLDWLKSVGIIVQNLTSDFQDGKNICKLVNVLEQDTIMPSQITDDALANATLAIDISSKNMAFQLWLMHLI